MARPLARRAHAGLPEWTRPRLTELVEAAPDGPEWLHEIKFDGYRMHARLDCGAVRLLSAPGSTGRTNTRRSQRPWRRLMPTRPISAARTGTFRASRSFPSRSNGF